MDLTALMDRALKCHLIQGEAGCRYAVEHGCVAVVVDALRASATAAMLLQAGAVELIVVGEVAEAFAAKASFPGALLFGERGALPPPGFDFGNSPRFVSAAEGRRVIFTTTTGAQRLLAAWGARAVYMGTTLNAASVATAAMGHGVDVVLIPAGLATDAAFSAQEDWVAAAAIALSAKAAVGQGLEEFEHWRSRIAGEGIARLFHDAPHAEKLRRAGLEEDIDFCARVDVTAAVPHAVARKAWGLVVRNEGVCHVSI